MAILKTNKSNQNVFVRYFALFIGGKTLTIHPTFIVPLLEGDPRIRYANEPGLTHAYFLGLKLFFFGYVSPTNNLIFRSYLAYY